MRARAGAATETTGQYGKLPAAQPPDDWSEAAASISAPRAEQLGEIQEIHMTRKIFHMLWVRTVAQSTPRNPTFDTNRAPNVWSFGCQGAGFIVARHQLEARHIYKFDRVLALMLSFTFLIETVRDSFRAPVIEGTLHSYHILNSHLPTQCHHQDAQTSHTRTRLH